MYQVSNLGRVRSLDRLLTYKNGRKHFEKGKILKCGFRGRYKRIGLCRNGKYTYKSIHRLVAETFIPNDKKLPQVNHIDNNPINNCVDNLEWVTASQNSLHAHIIGVAKPPMLGKKHSLETRLKISESRKGVKGGGVRFLNSEAEDIIERKLKGEKKKKVYSNYKEKITLQGFGNIWYGRSYKDVWKKILSNKGEEDYEHYNYYRKINKKRRIKNN